VTLRQLGEWCLSWSEDQHKQVKVDDIPECAKTTDLSIIDDGSPRAHIKFLTS
jgi:hypothetical protein